MCAPIAIAAISLGLSTVSSVASYVSNKRQAADQRTADQAFYDANKKAAISSADINMTEIGLRQSQELLATGTQKYDANQTTEGALSSTKVAAADANISGHSVDAILNDISGRGSTEQARISTNGQLVQSQLQRDKRSELVTAQNNINSVRPSTIRNPSILTPIIGIGSQAISQYDYLKSKQPK